MMVACLAFFLAGTGTATAVVNALPKNSVGTAQLKSNAVTQAKIKNNAVVGSKVKNGSLKAEDFAADQLPKGDKGDPGAKGDKGDTGAPGLSEVERVEATVASSATDTKVSIPTCPTGKRVISGGWNITGGLAVAKNVTVVTAFPDSDGTKYNVTATENNPTASSWGLLAYALCAKVAA
jgi:hypothetical protein